MTQPRVLMVIAPDQFRDEELFVPRTAFLEAGWTVDTVSTQAGAALGMLGASEVVQKTLSDVSNTSGLNTYQAVVVVGGMGSIGFLWENQQLHQLLRQLASQKAVISAICLSGVVLAKAGLLNGRKATVWEAPESLEAYRQSGVTYTAEPVTVDDSASGTVITANGPDAAAEFARAIVLAVKNQFAQKSVC